MSLRLLFAFLLLPIIISAQNVEIFKPSEEKVKFEASEIKSNLKIDGNLKDAEWNLAKPYSKFIEIDPNQGGVPKQKTISKALYNKQYLYIGIFNQDTLGKKSIRVIDFKRDFNTRTSDYVGMSFDGFNDQRNAMVFTTNPYGVQRDFLSFDAAYVDLDWDGLWKVRTTRSDSGWYAEFAIPWKTLRYSKPNSEISSWGYNINRGRRITNENYALSPFPRSFTVLRMDYAGRLEGIKPPPPSTNVRIQPYFLTSFDKYKNIDGKKPQETAYKIGGEIKWAITPNSVLDLTFNTDFAQADADRQVNNVTRFSVFFPERRQFFLENASLFGVGISQSSDLSGGSMRIQPFFSRQIGLDGNGNPIPIEIGTRFVHRSTKTNFGGMFIKQSNSDIFPSTYFGVARFSQNFGKQHRIGGIMTTKSDPINTNIISTIDGFSRFNAANSLNWMLTSSYDTKLKKSGFAGAAQYFYANNQWKIWWTQSLVTKDYNPEVGFVSRTDVVGTTPGIFYYNRGNWLPFKKILRSYEPSILLELYHQASTMELTESSVGISPFWFMLQSGGFIGHIYTPYYQNLLSDFVPLGVSISQGEYNYGRHMIYWGSDGSKKVSFTWIGEYGKYFDGNLNSTDFKLNFAPLPHVTFNARFNRNHFIEVGESKTTTNVDLIAFEGRLAMNPRLQLIGFYQRNNKSNAQNYNLRLSWEYQPLSYIYLVFNNRQFNSSLKPDIRSSEDHAIAKISYLRQF
jgi:Domain of unknown function (DUF5916)/Carbohydrate family 9 binding domain-like